MNCRSNQVRDTSGAATELGYIFTFLLGVLLLSVFSIWTWDIETATRERWNEEAIQVNLDDLAAAVERADEASRLGNIEYTECVWWRATEANENLFTITLSDNSLLLVDEGGGLDTEVFISGAGVGNHTGSIELSGAQMIWVTHKDGLTSIDINRPQ
ncbi:MAG TPA: hypothetical protein HA327_01900 [Candidatus Poseidoniaceae archaeon]|nr:MAG TPA: hypothetical protein D7H81_01880 [Candidatus Poseidoniales archaeon]HII44769.1 hypothetical protein [Candidatus Poseidoniaceae archaeon]|tara:strand:- start:11722 stop:12192 length:471 start_codon:yes stop_codon:yes gene_type:complete